DRLVRQPSERGPLVHQSGQGRMGRGGAVSDPLSFRRAFCSPSQPARQATDAGACRARVGFDVRQPGRRVLAGDAGILSVALARQRNGRADGRARSRGHWGNMDGEIHLAAQEYAAAAAPRCAVCGGAFRRADRSLVSRTACEPGKGETETMEANPTTGGRGHETRDASMRNVIGFGAALLVLIMAGLLVSEGVLRYFEVRQPLGPPASPFENVRTLPPVPRLQAAPVEDLARYRAAQESALNSYGWVDQKAGVVRIPIDRAI